MRSPIYQLQRPRYYVSIPHLVIHVTNEQVFQFVGGAIGVSSSQAIFNNYLIRALPIHAPEVSAEKVLAVGAYNLQRAFSPAQLHGVLESYLAGLKAAWIFSTTLGGLAFLISLAVGQESIKTRPQAQKKEESSV